MSRGMEVLEKLKNMWIYNDSILPCKLLSYENYYAVWKDAKLGEIMREKLKGNVKIRFEEVGGKLKCYIETRPIMYSPDLTREEIQLLFEEFCE